MRGGSMKELKFETMYKWGGQCFISCPLDKSEWRKVGSTYCEEKCPHNKGIDREKNTVICDGIKE